VTRSRSRPSAMLTTLSTPDEAEILARIRSGELRPLSALGPTPIDPAAVERLRKLVEGRLAVRCARRAKR
jgi:hypothetical protein